MRGEKAPDSPILSLLESSADRVKRAAAALLRVSMFPVASALTSKGMARGFSPTSFLLLSWMEMLRMVVTMSSCI